MSEMKVSQRNICCYNMSKLINTTGNLVYPLITYILLKTLNIQERYIGILIMVITMMKIPGYLLGGIMGDKWNYKRIAIVFPILCGITMLLCNLVICNKMLVIGLLSLSKFMSGLASPSNVKILDSLTDKNKKEVFAQAYMSTNIGMAIASLCSGYLFSISYSLVFIIDGVTRIVSGLILWFIQIKVSDEGVRNTIEKKPQRFRIVGYLYKQHLWEYILATELYIYIYSQYSYAIPLELENLFEHTSENVYSIVLFVNCITVIVSTPIIKRLSKQIEPLKCIQFSFVLLFCGFCMYYMELNIIAIILSTILWSIGEVLFGINELIYISQHTQKEYFARTVSIYDSLQNIIIAIAPMINSFFITMLSLKVSWILLGILCIIGAFSIKFFQRREKIKILERTRE